MDDWSMFEDAGGTATATDDWATFEDAMPKPAAPVAPEPDGFDYINADLTKTSGWGEMTPDMQESMLKLQSGWQEAGQPDPAAEQSAADWWKQQNVNEAVGEPPPDATELERLTFNRRKELITGEPSDAVDLAALQAAYENETDPGLKKQRLVDFQVSQRRDEIRRAQLAGEVADIKWSGSSPDQKITEERMQVEAGLGPDMALANAPIMRGAMTGVQNAASGIAEAALRILPGEGAPSDLADKIGRQRLDEGQRQGYLDQQQGSVAALPNAVTQMTGEYLPLAAAGVPAPLQVGVKGMNDAYLQSDSDAYALTSGIVQGALTYAGGKLAGGTFIDMLSGKVAGKTLGPMLKGFGMESAEELGQLYGQAMIDRGYGVGDGRMPTLKEAMWTLAVVAGSRGVGTVMSGNIEDDGVKQPSVFDALKNFSDRKWPSRKAAKEAGVDQIATTSKQRSELAADIRDRITAEDSNDRPSEAVTSPEDAGGGVPNGADRVLFSELKSEFGETYSDDEIWQVVLEAKGAPVASDDISLAPSDSGSAVPPPANQSTVAEDVTPEVAPTVDKEVAYVQSLVDEAMPKSAGKVERSADGLRVSFPNGKSAAINIVEEVPATEAEVIRALENYEIEDTPENRAQFRANIRGRFEIGGRDVHGIIHLRSGLGENASGVMRHELVHFARQTGAWTEAEWNALVAEVAPDAVGKSDKVQEEAVTRAIQTKPVASRLREFIDRILAAMGVNVAKLNSLATQARTGEVLAKKNGGKGNATAEVAQTADFSSDITGQGSGDKKAPSELAAKNASMDEARAAMGLPEINKPAAPGANMPHHIAEQEAIRQGYPERASGIVMDYLSDKRKEPLSQLETAGLAVYGDRLNEAYARLSEDVNNLTLDDGERMTKAAEIERIEQDFDLLSRAMRQSGTAQSLAFSQRKHVVGSDYRPLAVESRAAAAKGAKLNPNEKRKVKKAVNDHKAAEDKLAEQEKKEEAQVATKREKIKTEARKIREKIAKAKPPADIKKTISNLSKQFIAEGVVSRRELIDKVQKAVREVFPETQRRQVIDAISGYGDFKTLSKDEVSVRLRDLKGQLQQISKLKDMSDGKAPAKTGMERRDPSDTERALIKEVNEAKKAGNYEVTDPAKQLASALSTIKTRLRNQIKDLQDQINSREKLIKTKKAPPSDEETKRLTEERDAVKQQFEEMFGKPEMTDEQRIAIAERAVKKSITEYERRLAAGEYPAPPVSKTPQTPELLKLRAERDRLRSQYQSGKPVSLDEKKRIEAATKAVEKSIADLENRLKSGDYSKAAKRPAPNDPKLKALRDQAELLRKKYAETNPNPPALEKAKERLATLEAHLKAGTLPTITPRAEAKNPALKAIQQQLTDARKQLSESEPAQKARLLKTIGELNAKLQAGNFSLPEGAPRPPSPEIERLQYERDKARRKIRAEINALKPQSWWGHATSPFNAARQIITTLDFPPVFRQGSFIALGNPVRAAKATYEGFKAMFSDFNARKSLSDINARPNAPLYARAKLYLADMDGSPSAREEAFVGRLVEKIPGVRSIIHASERNYTVFLNQLRADTFDAMASSLSRNGEPTMQEIQAIAKFINVATGRGDFGTFDQAMTGLAPVFFSPRYVASRFQLLAGQPLYGGTAATRSVIAKEYGKMLIGAGVVYAIALAAGAELEDDPTSSDFGKLKFGNTRLDPLGGLSQTAVFASRMGSGVKKTLESWASGTPRESIFLKDEGRTAWNFLRSKFSPLASLPINLATGETAGHEAVTPGQIAKDLTIPLSFRDLKKTVEEQGVPAGTAMWLVSLFGMGLQTYESN